MRDLNKVMLIGNLTRDPEMRTTPTGQNVTSFSVATNRAWNDASGQKQTAVEFTNIIAWGKLGEIVNEYASKGRKVYVEGRLQTSSWDDKDGTKKYKTEVIASDVSLLDRNPNAGERVGANDPSINQDMPVESRKRHQTTKEESSEKREAVTAGGNDESEEINIEDIPF